MCFCGADKSSLIGFFSRNTGMITAYAPRIIEDVICWTKKEEIRQNCAFYRRKVCVILSIYLMEKTIILC